MTAFLTFMLGWSIRSALVIVLAWGICALATKMSAAAKNVVWRGALAATLFIGVGMLLTPQIGVQASLASPIAETLLAPQLEKKPSAVAPVVPTRYGAARAVLPEGDEQNGLLVLVGVIYLFGATWVIARWATSLAYVRQLCRSAQPMTGQADTLLARDLQVPFTLGWRRPVIVLPELARSWSDGRLSAVILHERAHMKRNDWFWQSLATVTSAVQWFNPAAWLLSSSLQATAEEAADNEVLAAGISPSAYAKELMGFASQSSVWPVAATGLVRPGRLAKRLKNLLAVEQNRGAATPRLCLSAGFVFGAIGLGFASYSPSPSATQEKAPSKPKSYSHPDKFADGSKPSILFIADGGSSRLPTWLVNGQMTNKDLPKEYGFAFSSGVSSAQMRSVAVCFRLVAMENSLAGTPTAEKFPARLGGASSHGEGASISGGSSVTSVAMLNKSYEVPKAWKMADLEIGRGVGEYVFVGQSGAGKKDFDVKTKRGDDGKRSGKDGKVEAVPTSEIRYTIPESAEGREWRLSAFDKSGKTVNLMGSAFFPEVVNGHKVYSTRAFAAPEEIDHFVLEARDYEWVAFKNLPLYPRK